MTSLMAEPSPDGRFGEFGGRFVPETLMPACLELEAAFRDAWADPDVPRRARRRPARLRRPAVAAHRVPQPGRPARPAPAAQARGPQPHRQPQDQQRARPGAAGPAHGQAPPGGRDRRRPARRGHRHRRRAARHGLRRLHGRRRRRAPGPQRVPHEAARRRGVPGRVRQPHAEGRRERGHARLGGDGRDDPLLPRLGDGPAPVPVDGARAAAGDRRRGPRAVPGPHRRRPRRRGGVRRRRLERGRASSPASSTPTPSWSAPRPPAAPPSAGACPAWCTG